MHIREIPTSRSRRAAQLSEGIARLGGTCSGGHGVGLHKIVQTETWHGEGVALMMAIKNALALVFEPKALLPDEPLSSLDAKLRLQMGDEFRAIQRRLGMTTLDVTHDQSEAMVLSDRVVVMDRGRIFQVGANRGRVQREEAVRFIDA
jgi:ABC-type cobalamin/Fe3+-siderophores transport system ATPase subunit